MERAIPRVFSAVVMLLLAALTSPTVVGVYSIVTLMFTAAQSATDTAVRQVLIRAVTDPAGGPFLRRYTRVAPVISSLAIAGLIFALWLAGTVESVETAVELLPIALAPYFAAFGVRSVGELQAVGRWKTLAQGQMWAAVVSLVVSVPVMLLTHSVLGPALQLLLVEAVFALWCRREAAQVDVPMIDPGPQATSLRSDMTSMSAFSLIAWFQGQAERVLMASFVGPAALGTYSTASAVARAPGEALAASTSNVVRTAVARAETPSEVREAAEGTLSRSLLLAGAAVLVSIVAAIVLRPLLGPKWHEALAIVPILSISAFPSMLSWSSAVLQVRMGQGWHTLWAPLVGITFAVGIAVAAGHSLVLASYLVVARDLAVVTVGFLLVRDAAPWTSYARCWAIVLVLGVITYFIV